MFAKFFLSNSDACDLQPAVPNFATHGKGERHWKHLPWDPFKVPIIVKTQKIINDKLVLKIKIKFSWVLCILVFSRRRMKID